MIFFFFDNVFSIKKFDPSQFALPFVVDVICLVLKTITQQRLNQAKKVYRTLSIIIFEFYLLWLIIDYLGMYTIKTR
jgi:hypothetical protein